MIETPGAIIRENFGKWKFPKEGGRGGGGGGPGNCARCYEKHCSEEYHPLSELFWSGRKHTHTARLARHFCQTIKAFLAISRQDGAFSDKL